MACYSTIINTDMRQVEMIEKAAKQLGFQFEKVSDLSVIISYKDEKITMTRSTKAGNFGVSEKTKTIDYLQQEYNAKCVNNWGLNNGYKTKSEYQKIDY